MTRIVVGVDGTDASFDAVRWAVAEARAVGATVEVVHAWSLPTVGTSVGAVTGALTGAFLAAVLCEGDCADNGVGFVAVTAATGTGIGGLLGAIIDAFKR